MLHKFNEKGAEVKPRAIAYTRFSPRRDAEECQSCAWQLAELEQYAFKKGWRIANVHQDRDRSGADALRPELWAAIDELRKGDVLLVWKWDRLARDLLLQLQIEKTVEQKGATVVATVGDMPGNNPQAKFMRQVLGAVAELERKMISQRTSAAMLAMQRKGKRVCSKQRTPYGWIVSPEDPDKIIEDPKEQALRSEIIRRHEQGDGYRQIARDLANLGVKARCGGKFSDVLVRNICRRGKWELEKQVQ